MNTTLFGAPVTDACGAGVLAAKQPVLIVFDLDGTLTDSAHLGRILFKRVFMQMGFGEISDALADSFNGPTADEVCRIMGIGPERRAQYDRLIDEIEVELVHTIGRVYPGVHEMLAGLAQRAHLAILTNGSAAYCAACAAMALPSSEKARRRPASSASSSSSVRMPDTPSRMTPTRQGSFTAQTHRPEAMAST